MSPWSFSVWGIDIIGKISPKSSSGHEFILVAIDYFTKSSAYRPQTNGAVEAANKNIKRILRKMVETSRDWSEKLPYALWAYRTSFRTSTGATPYSLVYGMEAMLPVEIEMGSLRVALKQQIPEADWAQARFDQLNLLDERRLRATDHIRAYQRKMARAFKKRVKPRPLLIGDLVLKVLKGLIKDPRGKFRPNWSGPYFIKELTLEGAAWLMDLDGNRFSEPTNVDQLKRTDSVVFGLPGSLARSLSLTGCSLRRGHDRYLTEPPRSIQLGPHFSTLDAIMPLHLGVEIYGSWWGCAPIPIRETRTDSRVTILVEYMLDPFYGDGRSVTDLLQFSSFDREISYLLHGAIVHFPFGVQSHYFLSLSAFRAISIFLSAFRAISPVLVFRAIIPFQFGVQSHFSIFGVQSHHRFSVLAFRSMVSFSFGVQSCSSPTFGIQSHISSLAFRAIVRLHFDVQSHHVFLQLAFKAMVLVHHSESSLLLVYDVQSRLSQHDIPSYQFSWACRAFVSDWHSSMFLLAWRSEPLPTFVLAFRATSSFRHSESCFCFCIAFRAITSSFGVQSHALFHSTFRATIHSRFTTFGVTMPHCQFGIQSHHFLVSVFRAILITFSVLAFKAIIVAFSVSVFRAVITSQIDAQSCIFSFGVQSHHYRIPVRHSEPSSLLSLGIQSHRHFPFSVQSHHHFSVLAFRAIITSQFWRLEASSLLSLGIQSHRHFPFGVQSHHHFSVSAFRAIITSQFWRSEPSSLLSLGIQSHQHFPFSVQSHHHFSVSLFRAIITSQFQSSEPSSLLSFGVQSHHHFLVSVFRAISIFHSTFKAITTSQFRRLKPSSLLSFGIQSYHHFSVSTFRAISIFHSAFRAITTSQFWRSEPSSLLSLGIQSRHHFSVSAFRAIVIISQYRRSEPSSSLPSLTFRVTFPVLAFRAIIASSLAFRAITS
ncbi:hypothetical protein CK203_058338 [Vitis vinifera]|uniref:Integrase catalytic domain-containing protein n=1 Tax=Vitis vinifera TaxID=29760 RepID=A0A438GE25_VITVI|nr:hypothetical protein CK203_058338 [Vitis vinifera]